MPTRTLAEEAARARESRHSRPTFPLSRHGPARRQETQIVQPCKTLGDFLPGFWPQAIRLNIAPPGWRKTFDPLRDAFNAEHGWSRPDDPARARVQHPGHRAYVEAARLRTGLGLESEPRALIRDYLLQRVEHGTVRNRADVVAALQEAGLEVPRQGKDYITALDPETGDRGPVAAERRAVCRRLRARTI